MYQISPPHVERKGKNKTKQTKRGKVVWSSFKTNVHFRARLQRVYLSSRKYMWLESSRKVQNVLNWCLEGDKFLTALIPCHLFLICTIIQCNISQCHRKSCPHGNIPDSVGHLWNRDRTCVGSEFTQIYHLVISHNLCEPWLGCSLTLL